MNIISHRGNLYGPNQITENSKSQVLAAIDKGFDVEIDLWKIEKKLFLGHDKPQYDIDLNFLISNSNRLWIHCKNLEAFVSLSNTKLNYFWHEKDTVTLTSHSIPWCYPGTYIEGGITVLQDMLSFFEATKLKSIKGVCTDYPVESKYVLRLDEKINLNLSGPELL